MTTELFSSSLLVLSLETVLTQTDNKWTNETVTTYREDRPLLCSEIARDQLPNPFVREHNVVQVCAVKLWSPNGNWGNVSIMR